MARILPSGRVFGEISRLPNIQYAKEEHPLATLERASKSNLASIAVAGIDRIRKEIALNEAEEAEAKRLAETQKKMKELADHERAWLDQYERLQREQQQPAATPSIERPRIAVPAVDPTIDIRTIRGADGPAGLIDVNVAGGRAATTRLGEVQWAALTPEQRAFAHAVHSHPLAPTHLQQQAAAYGNDLQRDRTHGWAQHSENTLAKIQEAGFVWDGSRFVAQQPQAVGGVGGWLRSNAEEELAAIQKERAALQKQMQPMPTPRTGAEFIYAVMQETDPRRRAALLYQARNAIGDSPATIQEAFSGAATMRMQEKMLKGMSLADAAALAAKEFNVKESTLKVRQDQLQLAQDRAAKEAENIDSLIEKRDKEIERIDAEIARRKGAGRGTSGKRVFEMEVISAVSKGRMSYEDGVAQLRGKGIKVDALRKMQERKDRIDKAEADRDQRRELATMRVNQRADIAIARAQSTAEQQRVQTLRDTYNAKVRATQGALGRLNRLQGLQYDLKTDPQYKEDIRRTKEEINSATLEEEQAHTALIAGTPGVVTPTDVSVEEEETVKTPTQTITIGVDGSITETE